MNRMRLLISIAAACFGIVLPTALGFAWPDYDPVANYLSELGAVDAPHAMIMSFAGFLPAGLFWGLGAVLLLSGARSKLLWVGVFLLLGTSISYIGAAFFPCDAGCPLEGSSSQMMHNALGIIGYLTSPLGIALIGIHGLRQRQSAAAIVSFATVAATLIGFAMMANPEMDSARGAWQRLADFSLFLWLVAISALLRKPTAPN